MKYNEKYKFTETWFDIAIPGWEQLLPPMKSEIKNVLEVGCYEGRATVWLCENILNDSSIEYNYDIVDTFGGSLNESGMLGTKERLEEDNFIENNFNHNISFFPSINFNTFKGFSQEILPKWKCGEKYDLIYIDASHRADDTLVDAYYAHRMLKEGGIIIFDDYGWKDPTNLHPVNSPQLGIDVFYNMYSENYNMVLKGYQVGFQKTK